MLTTKSADDGEEADAGGLTPAVLEARYERTVNVQAWLVKVFQSTIHAISDGKIVRDIRVFGTMANIVVFIYIHKPVTVILQGLLYFAKRNEMILCEMVLC